MAGRSRVASPPGLSCRQITGHLRYFPGTYVLLGRLSAVLTTRRRRRHPQNRWRRLRPRSCSGGRSGGDAAGRLGGAGRAAVLRRRGLDLHQPRLLLNAMTNEDCLLHPPSLPRAAVLFSSVLSARPPALSTPSPPPCSIPPSPPYPPPSVPARFLSGAAVPDRGKACVWRAGLRRCPAALQKLLPAEAAVAATQAGGAPSACTPRAAPRPGRGECLSPAAAEDLCEGYVHSS